MCYSMYCFNSILQYTVKRKESPVEPYCSSLQFQCFFQLYVRQRRSNSIELQYISIN